MPNLLPRLLAFPASFRPPSPTLTLAALGAVLGGTSVGAQEASTGPAASTPAPGRQRTAPAAALVYSVNRTPERSFATARAVTVLSAEELRRKGARTLPEALMEEAGIFVQQTGYGGGSPIIRGLIGRQVLILIDGVRLNNATYRTGPVQYLSTVDLNTVERIEIVRGGDAVLASDALGGIINVVTKKGPPTEGGPAIGGSAFARQTAGSAGRTGRLELFGAMPRVRYIAGGTYRAADDVRPGGGGRIAGTGYDERAADVRADYFLSPERTLSTAYEVLEQRSVPRTDRLVDRTNLVFNYSPQRRQLATLRLQDLADHGWADAVQATVFWNRQDEGRQEVRTARPNVEHRLWDRNDLLGASVELGSFLGEAHRLIYGADASGEEIRSTRVDVDATTGVETRRRGTWTDGARYRSLALYVQDRFTIGPRVTTTLGARQGWFWREGREQSRVGALDLGGRNAALTATGSVVVHATRRTNLVANVTRGFRAPNLDDVSVFNERPDHVEVPNPTVKPEYSTTYEVGVKREGRISGSVFAYRSRLEDLMVRTAGSFRGLPFVDNDGNGVRDPSEPAVAQRRNMGAASVQGVELDAGIAIHRGLALRANHTWTRGDDRTDDVPLSRVPPAFGAVALRWSGDEQRAPRRQPLAGRPWADAVFAYAAAQRRLSPDDKADSRITASGTPGWGALSLRTGATLAGRVPVTLNLENLTDARYKYHGSGVHRPGRSVVLTARWGF